MYFLFGCGAVFVVCGVCLCASGDGGDGGHCSDGGRNACLYTWITKITSPAKTPGDAFASPWNLTFCLLRAPLSIATSGKQYTKMK
jgi:hypothetical protein